jgi:hypothetical protein
MSLTLLPSGGACAFGRETGSSFSMNGLVKDTSEARPECR